MGQVVSQLSETHNYLYACSSQIWDRVAQRIKIGQGEG